MSIVLSIFSCKEKNPIKMLILEDQKICGNNLNNDTIERYETKHLNPGSIRNS